MSRKNERDARLEHGDELLEASGINLEAPDDVLLPALVGAIGQHPDSDLTIAELLGSIPLDAAAGELLAWEARAEVGKDLKREIRRSLFRLQQRGVASAARPEAPTGPVVIAERAEPTGYLSPIDADGTRVSWLTRPRPEGGLYALCAIISDTVGMRRVDAYLPNKAQFKEVMADMATQGAPLVPAPAPYVDWLMWKAYKLAPPRGEEGGGYPLLRADFYTQPAEPVAAPPRAQLPEAPEAERARLLADSARLLGEHEMETWVLPEEMMKEHHARFTDAQASTVVINQEQMSARLTQIIDGAFDDVIAGKARSLYTDRMAEMALWFSLAGKPLPASQCDAVRNALADPAADLKQVSFLRALAFRSFLHLMPQPEPDQAGGAPGGAGPEGSSRLVSPSGSGLIIPPG